MKLEYQQDSGAHIWAKELIREILILTKPTHYGLEVSLNPRMHREICMIIEENFPDSI